MIKKTLLTAFWFVFISQMLVAQVGKTAKQVKIVDANNNEVGIPHLNQKVITLFYTDPDNSDVNDPLSDALTAKGFPVKQYAGIGVVNCKDTWIPNSLILMKVAQKQKQFPGSTILLDKKKIASKAWGLPDGNGGAVVVVIGKDGKIKYAKAVFNQDESKGQVNEVLEIVEREVNL